MKNNLLVFIFILSIASLSFISYHEQRAMLYSYYEDYKCIVQNELGVPVPDVRSINIQFSSFKTKGAIAYAYGMMEVDSINIHVSKKWWKELSDNERRILMYHELSHDVHLQKHCSHRTCLMYPNRELMIQSDAELMLRTALNEHHTHPRNISFLDIFK